MRLVRDPGAKLVGAVVEAFEDHRRLRVTHGLAGLVGQQVLLGNIGDIGVVVVLGQQVVERLVLGRPDVLGDGVPPFLGIGEHGIDVEHHAPEGEDPVLDHLADREFGKSRIHVEQPTRVS